MRKPDFFIVGAPKCGTSAMHAYLRQHPALFLPEEKEIYHFGKDLTFNYDRMDRAAYLKSFEEAKPEQRIGDATAVYLRSEKAAKELKTFNTEAQIIIMLRNPVHMIYSLHSEMLYHGYEFIENFEQALEAEEKREKGELLPDRFLCPAENFIYRKMGAYTKQVKRYFKTFGHEQVHVIIFDDFKSKTEEVYKKTLQFLDVNPNFQPGFKVVNPNKKTRFAVLRNFLKYMPDHYKQLSRILIPSKKLRKGLYEGLHKINTKYTTRPPLAPDTERALKKYYKKEIEQLSRLLDRDLMHWVNDTA